MTNVKAIPTNENGSNSASIWRRLIAGLRQLWHFIVTWIPHKVRQKRQSNAMSAAKAQLVQERELQWSQEARQWQTEWGTRKLPSASRISGRHARMKQGRQTAETYRVATIHEQNRQKDLSEYRRQFRREKRFIQDKERVSKKQSQQRSLSAHTAQLLLDMASQDQGVAIKAVNELRQEGSLFDGSLNAAFLWYANLQGANLSDADFCESSLRRANLQDAQLVGANLSNCGFLGANLQNTDFRDAWLSDSRFEGANLDGANLKNVNAEGVEFDGASLRGTDFRDANLRGSYFFRADLKDANLSHADLQFAELSTSLQGVDLSFAILKAAHLDKAELNEANLQDANLELADLNEADLHGANLQRTNLYGVQLAYANLEAANLDNANLAGTNLSFATLENAQSLETALFDKTTILPNGDMWQTGYDLTRFADAQHPDFWEWGWHKKPSYLHPHWYRSKQRQDDDETE